MILLFFFFLFLYHRYTNEALKKRIKELQKNLPEEKVKNNEMNKSASAFGWLVCVQTYL